MEPEVQTPPEPPPAVKPAIEPLRALHQSLREGNELHGVEWALIGDHGLRAGWAVGFFASLYYIFRLVAGTLFFSLGLVGDGTDDSAAVVIVNEAIPFLALIAATGCMALIEHRRATDYNLAGPRRILNFLFGVGTGFAAISSLVGILQLGGWLHLSSAAKNPRQDLQYAMLWGVAFLLVGGVEEGLFRCYPLSTLPRGINFWWALATQLGVCGYLAFERTGNGVWGVFLAAAIGLFPCLTLHMKASPRSAFWQAAWVTSTVFAAYHTENNGENWIGIFAAACIAFVFCVSVLLTGSAWWAVGCHAAWDWAETYFYGTADSGLRGQGNLFTATPSGNPLWSGGTDGPEGSLLVIAVILLLLLVLLALYGRKPSATQSPLPTSEESTPSS